MLNILLRFFLLFQIIFVFKQVTWAMSLDMLVSKPISSYSFDRIAFKFYTGVNHKVAYPACAFFDDRIISGIFGDFVFIFEIMV